MANEYRATKANLRVLALNDNAPLRVYAFRVEVWRDPSSAVSSGSGSGSRRMQIIS